MYNIIKSGTGRQASDHLEHTDNQTEPHTRTVQTIYRACNRLHTLSALINCQCLYGLHTACIRIINATNQTITVCCKLKRRVRNSCACLIAEKNIHGTFCTV